MKDDQDISYSHDDVHFSLRYLLYAKKEDISSGFSYSALEFLAF